MVPMRHKRIRFGHLRLNGVPVDVRYGDLLVAQDDASPLLDWEVVLATRQPLQLAQASYDVHIETADCGQLWGSGVLVRSDGKAHVLRGSGGLNGFERVGFDGTRPGSSDVGAAPPTAC